MSSLQFHLDQVNSLAIAAFDQANSAYNAITYASSLTNMRRTLESICCAIIFHRETNINSPSYNIIGEINQPPPKFISLGRLKGHIKDNYKNNLCRRFDKLRACLINIFVEEPVKSSEKVIDILNRASHAIKNSIIPEISYNQMETCKVKIRELIGFFYDYFLSITTISDDLINSLKGIPLSKEKRQENEKLYNYFLGIKNLYQTPIGIEEENKSISIANFYIIPEVKFVNLNYSDKFTKSPSHKRFVKNALYNSVHDLANDFLKDSVNQDLLGADKKQPNLLFILGYPGQGKTSFCKRFLHDNVEPLNLEKRIFFIKLRSLGNMQSFIADPIAYLFDFILKDTSLSFKQDELYQSTLVLDGLDELAMTANDSKSDILIRKIAHQIREHKKLKIIITSRIGYVDLDNITSDNILLSHLSELSEEQQIKLLDKYNSKKISTVLTVEQIKKINSTENINPFRQFLQQPVLFDLVVKTYQDFAIQSSIVKIYKSIFEILAKRPWDNKEKTFILEDLNPEIIQKFTSKIAFLIHLSEYGYIRKSDLNKNKEIKGILSKSKIELEHIVKYVMIAFYLQESKIAEEDNHIDDTASYAIEFLHLPFQKYLVADYIWTNMQEFLDQSLINKRFIIDSNIQVLTHINVFFQKNLDIEIKKYLLQIIEEDTENKKVLFDRLFHFAPDLLANQFLSADQINKPKPIHISINVFYAYWLIMAAISEGENTIPSNSIENFADMLRVQSALSPQEEWNLQSAQLESADLNSVKLVYANLKNANLTSINLTNADLSRADLSGADLSSANLSYANFFGANLTGANLTGADLSNADFTNTILTDADFTEANFIGVKNIPKHQLEKVKSLYSAKNLPEN